ncbi:MAG TPA: MFS transporter [Streptomyces sp.]|uniref:MFS transporter n=1 Tax=Streptomyces sp. TaxID=1931 RepID=UPI002D39459B|nr:MFS transporter [Streptomyces sp.]HZG07060.1 MFS transporter [Streptomyces sp.]
MRYAWAGRNYTLLTAAAVITGLGNSGALIAAAFAVLAAGGDGTDVGLVAAARTVPLVVFLLVGGAVADRLPRHRVMVAANALNCLSQGVFAALVISGEARLWQMVALSALGGTGHAFFAPAAEGMVLSSVRGEQAGRAFAVFRMGVNGASIGGAALGGALIAAVGPGWVLAVDAAAFAVAGALRAFLDLGGMPGREPGGGLLADLRDGWREVVGRPWLWAVVAQFSVVNAVVAAAEAVYGPQVAQEHLGGAGPWGVALAAYGAGTVLGGLLMTRWRPRRILLTGTLCVFPLALPSAALAVPVPAGWLVAVMFATGVALEVFGVTWMMALHQEVPEEKFSRVSSYDWLGSIALVPVATAVAGPVETVVGRPAALWGCSALVALLTAAVLCVPDVRNLTRRDAAVVAGGPATAGASGGAADQPTVKAPSGGSGEGTASAS